jgi:hypothetical protein
MILELNVVHELLVSTVGGRGDVEGGRVPGVSEADAIVERLSY